MGLLSFKVGDGVWVRGLAGMVRVRSWVIQYDSERLHKYGSKIMFVYTHKFICMCATYVWMDSRNICACLHIALNVIGSIKSQLTLQQRF